MWSIAMDTRLGHISSGQEVVIEQCDKKASLIKTLAPLNPSEVEEKDTGEIPGDHLGMTLQRHKNFDRIFA